MTIKVPLGRPTAEVCNVILRGETVERYYSSGGIRPRRVPPY